MTGGDDDLKNTPENDEFVFAEVRAKEGQVDPICAAYMLDIIRDQHPRLYYRWKRGDFDDTVDFRDDVEYGILLAEIARVLASLLRPDTISTLTNIQWFMGTELHARLNRVEPGEERWV